MPNFPGLGHTWIPQISLEDFVKSLPLLNWRRLHVRHKEFLDSQKKAGRYVLHGLKLYAPAGSYHPRAGSSSDFIIRHLPSFTKAAVLDVVTGTGVIGIYLAKLGNEVTVTDISAEAIRTATRNAFSNQVSITAVISDLSNGLPALQKFDRIVFNYPLYQKPIEHPDERISCDPDALLLRRFLAELNVRLKRGGFAYLTYSNLGDAKLLVRRLRRKRFYALVIGFEHDSDTGVVKYLLEIRRGLKA